MKIKFLFLFAISLSILSCSDSEQEIPTFKNTAELNQFWVGEQTLKTVGKAAHSGERVSYMDSTTEYGLGLKRKMSDVQKPFHVQKVVVKAWIYSNNPNPGAKIIVDIRKENDKDGSWNGIPLDKLVNEANQWKQIVVEHTFNQTELEDPENKLINIYVWKPSKKDTVLVDDMEVEFYPEE